MRSIRDEQVAVGIVRINDQSKKSFDYDSHFSFYFLFPPLLWDEYTCIKGHKFFSQIAAMTNHANLPSCIQNSQQIKGVFLEVSRHCHVYIIKHACLANKIIMFLKLRKMKDMTCCEERLESVYNMYWL